MPLDSSLLANGLLLNTPKPLKLEPQYIYRGGWHGLLRTPSFCYILCYTLGVLRGSVTAVGQRIRRLEGGGRSCLFQTSRSTRNTLQIRPRTSSDPAHGALETIPSQGQGVFGIMGL